MVNSCFVVFDAKAKAYLTPFFFPTAPMAVRVFSDCVNDEGHQFGKHPEDYTLFGVGSFSDEDGVFSAKSPELIVSGLQVRRPS